MLKYALMRRSLEGGGGMPKTFNPSQGKQKNLGVVTLYTGWAFLAFSVALLDRKQGRWKKTQSRAEFVRGASDCSV